MADITGLLPTWLANAAIPAGAVMSFFWKGDDAIGPGLKNWLTRKITGQNSSDETEVSTIDPLRHVFDVVYGTRPNGLPSFLRVTLISTLAFLVFLLWLLDFEYWGLELTLYATWIVVLIPINALFDYVSVTKALFIMRRIGNVGGGKTLMFLVLDFLCTFLIIMVYAIVVESMGISMLRGMHWGIPFLATTFLTFLLTLLYVLAVRVLSGLKLRSGISWALPVETLPVRSIGIMAGFLVFLISLVLRVFSA